MSKLKNDKAQYEKYLSGKMSAEEANAFERELLNDSFGQEALEGFEQTDPALLADVEKLQSKILKKENAGFGWMRIAAVVALLIVGSFTVWLVVKPIAADQELAMEKTEIEEEAAEESSDEELTNSFNSDKKKAESLQQTEKSDEVGPEIKEAESVAPVVAEVTEMPEEEALEEVAFADNEADDLAISSGGAVELVELEVAEVKEEVFALEAATTEKPLGEATDLPPLEDAFFELDTVGQIDLAQNLVAQSDQLESTEKAKRSAPANFNRERRDRDLTEEVSMDGVTELEEVTYVASPTVTKKSFLGSAVNTMQTVAGKITDERGEGLPGVNVVIKGTTTGVTSDLDGNFQLSVDPNATLVISFVGFETHEVEVGNRSTVDITLGGVTELQEVVVTGYGEVSSQATSFTPARPLGGNKDFKKYLEENLQYPEQAQENDIEGTVVLELTISSNGSITNIDLKKSLGYGCDEEAIRLVNEGPKWSGTERNGSRVEDKVKVRVKFKR